MKRTLTIADRNKLDYLDAPTWNQIEEFIDELGVKMYQFERFYHIPYNLLTQVKSGVKRLPPQYWHFIYEKIKPAYGSGYLDDFTKIQPTKRINSYLTQKLTDRNTVSEDSHDRLSKV